MNPLLDVSCFCLCLFFFEFSTLLFSHIHCTYTLTTDSRPHKRYWYWSFFKRFWFCLYSLFDTLCTGTHSADDLRFVISSHLISRKVISFSRRFCSVSFGLWNWWSTHNYFHSLKTRFVIVSLMVAIKRVSTALGVFFSFSYLIHPLRYTMIFNNIFFSSKLELHPSILNTAHRLYSGVYRIYVVEFRPKINERILLYGME